MVQSSCDPFAFNKTTNGSEGFSYAHGFTEHLDTTSDSNDNSHPPATYSSLVERALIQRLMLSNGRRGVQEGGTNSLHLPAYHPTTAAALAVVPEHQEYSNNLELALSRYGYGYPSVAPSLSLTRNGPNQTMPANISQALAAAAHSNRSFSSLTSRAYQPYPNSPAPLDQWASSIYTPSPRFGPEDLMLLSLHRSSQLHSFGDSHVPGYESNGNNSSPQLMFDSPLRLIGASTSDSLRQASPASSAQKSSSTQQDQLSHQNGNGHVTGLATPSDAAFLEPVHIFLRTTCIKVFVSTRKHLMRPGRGARASHVGQIGLCCAWCKDTPRQEMTRQAVCYPSKRDTIFESVRNYQRVHIESCPHIPDEMKAQYKRLLEIDVPNKKSQRFVKAYYAETATDLGLVDSPKGLVFGVLPNKSGIPSERVMAIIRAAESPAYSSAFWKSYSSSKDKSLELRKFEHLASESTREVIRNARKQASAFVRPQDFPTVSDFEFLLFMQVGPCKPRAITLERRGIDPADFGALSGLCCRHCARIYEGKNQHKGMWFPPNVESLVDSSISQSVLNHMMTCENAPQELKDTFDELKRLASEHCVVTKRGSKKKFLEKIWGRMANYYDE